MSDSWNPFDVMKDPYETASPRFLRPIFIVAILMLIYAGILGVFFVYGMIRYSIREANKGEYKLPAAVKKQAPPEDRRGGGMMQK